LALLPESPALRRCFAIVSAPSDDSGGRSLRRTLYFIAACLLLGLLSLHGAYIWSFGDLQGPAIQAVLQTDIAEALGYIASNLLVPWAVFWSASLLLLWLTYPASREPWVRLRLVIPVLVVGTAGFLWLGRGAVSEPIEVVKSYREGMQDLREAADWWSRHPAPPAASDLDATVILVLGESTSRHHMALYGYPRDTTPNLSAITSELAVFDDVISSHSSTVESLLPALTVPLSALEAGARPERPISIVQLANAAGFETHWLSNQNEFGVWDSPIRILGATCPERTLS
jgi:glucan phosphoethanolaminetransferase (alkaline phosphatase superfamily)